MRPFAPLPPWISPVLPLRSRPVRTPLLGLCFFLSLLQASASQWLPLCRSRPPLSFVSSGSLLTCPPGSSNLRFLQSSVPAPHFFSPLGSLPWFVSRCFLRSRLAPFRIRPSSALLSFGTRFCCSSFHRSRFRLTAATSFRLPSLSGSGLPLSFFRPLRFLQVRSSSGSPPRFHASFSPSSALGFRLLGIMIHPEN